MDRSSLDNQLPAKSQIIEDQTLSAEKAATKQKEYRFQDAHLVQSRLIMVRCTTVKQELVIVRKTLQINKDGIFGRHNP